jgi:hypothetical protein
MHTVGEIIVAELRGLSRYPEQVSRTRVFHAMLLALVEQRMWCAAIVHKGGINFLLTSAML